MLTAYAKTRPFKGLANVPVKQAVQFEKKGVIQAVFYQADTITADNLTTTIDRPAVVMLTPNGTSWTLRVSDPVQKTPA